MANKVQIHYRDTDGSFKPASAADPLPIEIPEWQLERLATAVARAVVDAQAGLDEKRALERARVRAEREALRQEQAEAAAMQMAIEQQEKSESPPVPDILEFKRPGVRARFSAWARRTFRRQQPEEAT
jgi:hypothetical protein